MDKFYQYQDKQTSAWNLYLSGYRWFGLRVDWCIWLYLVLCIIVSFVVTGNSYLEFTQGFFTPILMVWKWKTTT